MDWEWLRWLSELGLFPVVVGLLTLIGAAGMLLYREHEWSDTLLALTAPQTCRLCGSAQVDVRDEARGLYHCVECGFDTDMCDLPAVQAPLALLRLVDNACGEFEGALAPLQMGSDARTALGQRGTLFKSDSSPLEAAISAQLSGLNWLSELAQAYREGARAEGEDGRNSVAAYLEQALEQDAGKRVGMFSGLGEQRVRREVRAHLKFARQVRAQIVAQVREQAGLE